MSNSTTSRCSGPVMQEDPEHTTITVGQEPGASDQDPPQPSYLYQTQGTECRDPLPFSTTEEIETELGGKAYAASESSGYSQSFSTVNTDIFATLSENVESDGDEMEEGEGYVSETPSDSDSERISAAAHADCSAAQNGDRVSSDHAPSPGSKPLNDSTAVPTSVEDKTPCKRKGGRLRTSVEKEKMPPRKRGPKPKEKKEKKPRVRNRGKKLATPCLCQVCGKTFNFMNHLINHARAHAKDKKHCCGVCGEEFRTAKSMIDHLIIHMGKIASCDLCGKCFTTVANLNVHITRQHRGERPFKCSVCEKCFYTLYNLKSHEVVHSGKKPYHCRECGKHFPRSGTLINHMKNMHKIEKPCPTQGAEEEELGTSQGEEQSQGLGTRDCDQDPPQPHLHQTGVIENKDSLPINTTKDLKPEPDRDAYKAPEAAGFYLSISATNTDLSAAQSENAESYDGTEEGDGYGLSESDSDSELISAAAKADCAQSEHSDSYYAEESKEPSSGSKPVKSHSITTGAKGAEGKKCRIRNRGKKLATPSYCQVCGKPFDFMNQLINHALTHAKDKKHCCGVCGEGSRTAKKMTAHMIIHIGEMPFCYVCGKCFTTNANLNVHVRCHVGERPYKCSECGKCFQTSYNLKTHEASHTGEKPFHCEECGKHFTRNGSLTTHMKIHTSEKPHRCQVCGQCFPIKRSLTTHMTKHTGLKPYKCKDCGKCFTVSEALTVHMKTHTGEKAFKCTTCEKCFITAGKLSLHQRVHTGVKPHMCKICNKSFNWKGALRKHLSVIHKQEDIPL